MYITIAMVTLVIILFHWTAIRKFSYWKRKGFPHLPGYFPFGTSKEITLLKRYQGFTHQELYNKLSSNSYGGIYLWNEPILLIRDPEIIHLIMVKEFQHFRDRGRVELSPKEPLSQHLFYLDGDIWRALRIKLSPTFTSGRLKLMYSLFEIAASKFDEELMKTSENGESVNIKDISTCFTLDIILSCAFGLESNAAKNVEFRKTCQTVFKTYVPIMKKIILAIYFYFPFMRRFLDANLVNKKFKELIFSIVVGTVKYREENNVRRNDFLDLMIQLKNKGKLESESKDKSDAERKAENESLEITSDLLVAQCFLFFAAGFETSSSVQSNAFYELAMNQDVQDKLRKEIDDVTRKHGGEVDYQTLNEMHYLDQVISEVLRKYPTVATLERKCSKKFLLPDNPELIIEKGTKIWIPVYSLHHDPIYFQNPEKFNPERFSPENKSSIVPFSYLPFGEGPRHCIGMRFGLLQTKLGIFTVIRKYKVMPAKETPSKLGFVPTSLISVTDGPIKLIIQRRDDLKAS